MKKWLLITLSILVISAMVLGSCGEPETTTPTTTAPATTTPTTQPTTEPGPVSGGTARVINASGVNIMGYSLEQSPWDLFVLLCAVEKLIEYDKNQNLVGHLAESYSFDDAAKTINVKMREGIRFHDGSDCDAEAIAWNFEQQVMNQRIGYIDQWDYLEVIDKYNFAIHYKGDYNNQLPVAWLWSPPIYSMAAFVNAGNGDIEKSKDWARQNVSGTGPFKQGELIRDVSLTMVRNDDYWGSKPYLDSIHYMFIPDPVTASLKMKAGEADLWFSVSIKDQLELIEAGLTRLEGQPNVQALYPNIINPDSKWQNKDLREAIEYALDKEGMAEALGFGYYKAAKMIVPEGKDGYDEDWAGRSYDPDKARELLATAGFETSLPSLEAVQALPLLQDSRTGLLSLAVTEHGTLALLLTGKLRLSKRYLGTEVKNDNGDTYQVFRNINMLNRSQTRDSCVFVVSFKFARLSHRANKLASVVPMLLIAGFPGFRHKLYGVNALNGYWQGMYEWKSIKHLEAYKKSLVFRTMLKRAKAGSVISHELNHSNISDWIKKHIKIKA